MAKTQKKNTKKDGQADDASAPEFSHIGEQLKATREAAGLDQSNVAEELMIRRFYLQAIEDGNFKELPAPVYAIGFIKNYAEFLNLDSHDAVVRFKKEAYGTKHEAPTELVFPDPLTASIVPSRAAIFAGAGVVVLVLMIILVVAWPSNDGVDVKIPQAPVVEMKTPQVITTITEKLQETEIIVPTSSEEFLIRPETAGSEAVAVQETIVVPEEIVLQAAPAAAVISQALPQSSRVTLEIEQTSWVEVTDGQGNILLSRILKPGQTYDVPNQSGVSMITGNAGGVRIVVDGQKLPKMGSTGDVKRNQSLDPDALLKILNSN